MGGGKKKSSFNKSKPRNPNQSLFIDGGILAGFDQPSINHPGNNSNSKSGSKFKSSANGSGSVSKTGFKDSPSNAYPYHYPFLNSQDVLQSGSDSVSSKGTRPFILLDTKDNKIVAFEDTTPSTEASKVSYQYEMTSGFVLGESSRAGLGLSNELEATAVVTELSSGVLDEDEESHTGLGFSDKPNVATSGVVFSSEVVQDKEELSCDSSCPELEEDDDDAGYMDEDDSGLDETMSSEKNSAFVSIGGIRLYTEDISDSESNDDDEELSDEGSSSGSSESDGSEDTSNFDSDIDEDVMQDYLEGIGGSSKMLDSQWLALQDLDTQQLVDDDSDDTSDGYDGTLKKLSGVSLQEASREYGKPKKRTTKKPSPRSGNSKHSIAWDPSLDDAMFLKDPRRVSAKKKHVTQFPQSWPSDAKKSKKFGRFPGEKKKLRKERIAAKRRDRMLHRGVDLEKINSKLRQMVLNNGDMVAFQPMHARDCSQVQRLAAIYRLRSGCQGSGKKRFVTVSRTQHTCMPCASDEIRLEKLIGASKDDADFPVVDTPQRVGSSSGHHNKSNKHSTNHQSKSGKSDKKRNSDRKPVVYSSQPVSFVSSGVMQPNNDQADAVEPKDISNQESKPVGCTSSTIGSFEVHTKGFGSKMMAKMGYVEGEGLGKDGKGMSQPIEVIQRPKSLGLGMTFEESSSEAMSAKMVSKPNGSGGSGSKSRSRSGSSRKGGNPNGIGAFEKHTKGFGSKMMARMGFVEGTGLGRDSQGIVTPLTAVRRPKARGLGAEGNG